MSTLLRRIVLCLSLLAVLLVSAVIPVFIILGIHERWFWFFPYATFVVAIVFLMAIADRSGRQEEKSAPRIGAFVASRLVLTMIAVTHAALLVVRRIDSFAIVETPWPEVAAALFLLLAGGYWFLHKSEKGRRNPLWLEVLVDLFAFATLFASAVITATSTGF